MVKANPLLSELDAESFLGRRLQKLPVIRRWWFARANPPLWILAVIFPTLGLIAAVLSILSRAGAITVQLAPVNDVTEPVSLHFGYLYELNAALFYVSASWIWVLAFLYFLKCADGALTRLSRAGRLTARTREVPEEVRRLNRRWCCFPVMLTILLVSAFSVIGTEFNPIHHKGDYWQLAFGYVQASAMPHYPHVALDQLGRSIRNKQTRKIRPEEWLLESVSGGPVTPFERKVFPWFLVFAVGVETLFAPFAAWTVIKVAFFFYMLYRALVSRRYPLQLSPLPDDCEKQLGLSPLNPVYRAVVYLVYISMAVELGSVISNVEKGSGRALEASYSDQLAVLFGQGAVTYVPVILLLILAGFLVPFSFRLRSMQARARQSEGDGERAEHIQAQRFVLLEVLGRFRLGTLIYMFAPLLIRLKWDSVSPWYDRWRGAADTVDRAIRSSVPWH